MPSNSLPHADSGHWRAKGAALLVAVSAILMVAALWNAFRAEHRTEEVLAWRDQSSRVLSALERAMTAIQEMDSTQRGYLVTGDEAYFKYQRDARANWKAQVEALQGLLQDQPRQEAALSRLVDLVAARGVVEDQVVRARQAGDTAGMLSAIRAGRGRGGMEQIRAAHDEIQTAERRRLDEREAGVAAAQREAFRALELAALLALLLLSAGVFLAVRQRRIRSMLEASWRRNTDLLDTTPDFVVTVRPGGQAIYWNRALRRLRGLEPGEPVSASFGDLFSPESRHTMAREALPAASAEGRWVGEGALLGIRGEPVPVSLVVLAHRNAAGLVTAYSAIARSLEEQKATERLKSDFIASVNHELRTPLSALKGALGLLRAGTSAGMTESQVRELLDIAGRNGERLSSLINELLDIERLEADAMPFHLTRQSLEGLVDEAARNLLPLFQSRGVALLREGGVGDAVVSVDEGRFAQILANLLSNAVKFSPRGEPVRLRTAPGLADPTAWRVEVENGGPGIPDAFRSRIFQKFSQAESPTGERPGTGLGLVIARTLADRMGGTLGYESAPGRTIFWVEFPGPGRAREGEPPPPG